MSLSLLISLLLIFIFFFFNDTATTEIYTLSLHDALPIQSTGRVPANPKIAPKYPDLTNFAKSFYVSLDLRADLDRKSTRLNSSHTVISYAVFCLKKKKKKNKTKNKKTKHNRMTSKDKKKD